LIRAWRRRSRPCSSISADRAARPACSRTSSLDHAGATASCAAASRPAGQRARKRCAAPRRPLPSCLKSAGRLYGDDMWELWGESAPVPRRTGSTRSGGREHPTGFRCGLHTGPRRRNHVSYLHEETGDAYVGDVAGVRIPPYARPWRPRRRRTSTSRPGSTRSTRSRRGTRRRSASPTSARSPRWPSTCTACAARWSSPRSGPA
jgi:hypothetical protein